MSVAEAQAKIDSPEFAEWQAYAMLEPFGGERDDERAGVIAATLANLQLDPKDLRPEFKGDGSKRDHPFGIRDFLPLPTFVDLDPVTGREPETVAAPPPDLRSKMMAWVAAHNAGLPEADRVERSQRPKKARR